MRKKSLYVFFRARLKVFPLENVILQFSGTEKDHTK
jgi:hypothetical protein